jgi:hypothetical protein
MSSKNWLGAMMMLVGMACLLLAPGVYLGAYVSTVERLYYSPCGNRWSEGYGGLPHKEANKRWAFHWVHELDRNWVCLAYWSESDDWQPACIGVRAVVAK